MEEEEGVPGRTVVFKPGVLSEELLPEENAIIVTSNVSASNIATAIAIPLLSCCCFF